VFGCVDNPYRNIEKRYPNHYNIVAWNSRKSRVFLRCASPPWWVAVLFSCLGDDVATGMGVPGLGISDRQAAAHGRFIGFFLNGRRGLFKLRPLGVPSE
jgi:hypothetical protein